jgi:hypothetical protein
MTLGIINPIGFDLFGWQGIFLYIEGIESLEFKVHRVQVEGITLMHLLLLTIYGVKISKSNII